MISFLLCLPPHENGGCFHHLHGKAVESIVCFNGAVNAGQNDTLGQRWTMSNDTIMMIISLLLWIFYEHSTLL